jgi:hypothetical protein
MADAQYPEKRLIDRPDRNLGSKKPFRMLRRPARSKLRCILRGIVPLHFKTRQPDCLGFVGANLARYRQDHCGSVGFREDAVTKTLDALEHLSGGDPRG